MHTCRASMSTILPSTVTRLACFLLGGRSQVKRVDWGAVGRTDDLEWSGWKEGEHPQITRAVRISNAVLKLWLKCRFAFRSEYYWPSFYRAEWHIALHPHHPLGLWVGWRNITGWMPWRLRLQQLHEEWQFGEFFDGVWIGKCWNSFGHSFSSSCTSSIYLPSPWVIPKEWTIWAPLGPPVLNWVSSLEKLCGPSYSGAVGSG